MALSAIYTFMPGENLYRRRRRGKLLYNDEPKPPEFIGWPQCGWANECERTHGRGRATKMVQDDKFWQRKTSDKNAIS